jgi:predicted nucleic acid-binding Zn ribbon protein
MRVRATSKEKIDCTTLRGGFGSIPPDPEYVDRGGICESGEVLEDLLKRLRLDEHVKNRLIREVWPSLVGEQLALRSYPDSLRRGVLVVRVTDSATNHHINALKEHILVRLNEVVDAVVRDIRICF